jgi:hypothetical protein
MSACPATALRYLGLTVRVESMDPEDLVWLEEFLVPPFELVEGVAGDCAVSCDIDAERHGALLRDGTTSDGATLACFALEQRLVRLPVWSSHRGERLVYDEEFNVFYRRTVGAPHVHLLTPPGNRAARIALMRAVREFATNQAWRSGGLVVHAAAFAIGDDGFVLAGSKGAGKTSLLTHMLRHREARFVSGDRARLAPAGDGPVIRGLPTLVSLRAGTLAMFPELRDQLATRTYQHALRLGEATATPVSAQRSANDGRSLSPAQFCELLGVTRTAQARLAAVLFPRVTGARGGIGLDPLSAERGTARLIDSLFRRTLSGQAPGLFDLHGVDPVSGEGSVEERCRAVAARVPCFECRLGLNAYDDPAGIDSLLEPLRG